MMRPIPPRDDLVKLAQECLFNARDLLSGARQMLDSARAPVAHALATLALEEAGKASMCVLSIMPPADVMDADTFWEGWRDHGSKLQWALGVLRLIIQEPDGPVSEAISQLTSDSKAAHLRKLRGFYVDYSQQSAVLTPSDITMAEARELIGRVSVALEFLLASSGDEGVFDRVRSLAEYEQDLTAMLAQIQQSLAADPDATFERVREWIRSQQTGS